MPNYTVPLEGGGEMHVNANSLQGAIDNVNASGNKAAANASSGSTAAANTIYTNASTNAAAAAASPGGQDMANVPADTLVMQQAQQAAYNAYLNSRLALDSDQEAYQKAAQAAATAIAQAGVTGTYNGQPTLGAMTSYANQFGTWGVPNAGQQTLTSQNQGFTQQQALASMYGQYYAPGQAPTAGQTTQAAQQQAYSQWLQAQQESRLQQGQQQQTAQAYLQMLANLRGPADYAKYQQVLGSTPGGMTDLVRAAAGQYIPGGGATTGVQPTPVSLQSFVGGLGQPDTSSQAAMNTLVAPNQLAPQTWNNLTPSQQQMLLGTWESQGYTKEDAQALFNQSLPKYASGSSSSGSFKLQ